MFSGGSGGLCPLLDQRCPPSYKRLERDGLLGRRPRLPTARQEAAPCAGQGPPGGLLGWALVAWWRGGALGPAGRPEGCGGPCDARVSAARRALAAPGHPSRLAAVCRPRRAPRLLLACDGSGRACSWCATGAQAAGRADGPGPRAGLEARAVGRARRLVREGSVDIGHCRQGDAALGDAGLAQKRRGRDTPGIGGERAGRVDGLATRGGDLSRAPGRRTAAGVERGTARALSRRARWPAPPDGAAARGVLLLQPGQDVRDIVLARPGQAVGAPAGVPDHPAAVGDEWGARPPGGALWRARGPRVARGPPQCALAGGSGGASVARLGGKASR